jgi:hypothetical protein
MDTQRVVEIIMEEAQKVEARHATYVDDICEVVAEIVNIERQHRFAARNVKQDIAAQINTLGTDLASKLAEQAL